MNMQDENNFDEIQEKPTKSPRFYIALFACLAAVTAAGWSTYQGVKDFISPARSGTTSQRMPKITSEKNTAVRENGKNSILEGKSAEEQLRTNEYKNLAKKSSSAKCEKTEECQEETQAVSAEKSELSITYPCNNNIIKEFSDEKPIYNKTLSDWRVHEGTDFKADAGSAIKSITGGTVKDIYEDSLYGTTVVISHDAQFTAYYSGLNKDGLAVSKGKRINAGEEIGKLSVVPCESLEEPHLHLMICKNDKFIDPLLVLEKETQ